MSRQQVYERAQTEGCGDVQRHDRAELAVAADKSRGIDDLAQPVRSRALGAAVRRGPPGKDKAEDRRAQHGDGERRPKPERCDGDARYRRSNECREVEGRRREREGDGKILASHDLRDDRLDRRGGNGLNAAKRGGQRQRSSLATSRPTPFGPPSPPRWGRAR